MEIWRNILISGFYSLILFNIHNLPDRFWSWGLGSQKYKNIRSRATHYCILEFIHSLILFFFFVVIVLISPWATVPGSAAVAPPPPSLSSHPPPAGHERSLGSSWRCDKTCIFHEIFTIYSMRLCSYMRIAIVFLVLMTQPIKMFSFTQHIHTEITSARWLTYKYTLIKYRKSIQY